MAPQERNIFAIAACHRLRPFETMGSIRRAGTIHRKAFATLSAVRIRRLGQKLAAVLSNRETFERGAFTLVNDRLRVIVSQAQHGTRSPGSRRSITASPSLRPPVSRLLRPEDSSCSDPRNRPTPHRYPAIRSTTVDRSRERTRCPPLQRGRYARLVSVWLSWSGLHRRMSTL